MTAAADELEALYPALHGLDPRLEGGRGQGTAALPGRPGESCVLTSNCLVGSSDYPASGG
jgi:hypothetical protein